MCTMYLHVESGGVARFMVFKGGARVSFLYRVRNRSRIFAKVGIIHGQKGSEEAYQMKLAQLKN